jgi:hypothetical protein
MTNKSQHQNDVGFLLSEIINLKVTNEPNTSHDHALTFS